MPQPSRFFSPSEAALRLGTSIKALRLYEEHGLIHPGRNRSGWRVYGPEDMVRAREIAALRALGLGLAAIGRIMKGNAAELEPVLARQQIKLEGELANLSDTIARLANLRGEIAAGARADIAAVMRLTGTRAEPAIAFPLPWPWDGELFELTEIKPITWVTGPLGSGKTRFLRTLSQALAGALEIRLDRKIAAEPGSRERAEAIVGSLIADGASASPALFALVVALCQDQPSALVVDLVEEALDHPTQEALAAWLRQRPSSAPPLFLMTRSTAMLDLDAVTPAESLILCPANHAPPIIVPPFRGAAGYEAFASCLASPEVRARTTGEQSGKPPVV
ncbi:MerR family transcriptional regulator [Martelella alba]|uniref:MerR family transcriptional regulator n=1 Tax=Martelella alba TaxID=2590451 RepID=A0A506UEZ5_9HYPH|nr:MerR family transcriptional regulator [Martelella alba]TPW31485.1 MerR family transcriptional regulator [Martelella alba]